MNDSLSVYLHDHLAGSHFAIQLLDSLSRRYPGRNPGIFAAAMLVDVKEDQKVLECIIERVGKSTFDLKDAMAWLAEKASRVKLRDDQPEGIGTFEAVEILGLGIMGKASLWQTLSAIAQLEPKLAKWDYVALSMRAQGQYKRVEAYRLSFAPVAFGISSSTVSGGYDELT
jgi:hypothetical protein